MKLIKVSLKNQILYAVQAENVEAIEFMALFTGIVVHFLNNGHNFGGKNC